MAKLNAAMEALEKKLERRERGEELRPRTIVDNGERARAHVIVEDQVWKLVARRAAAQGTTMGQVVRDALHLFMGVTVTKKPAAPKIDPKKQARRDKVKPPKPRKPRKKRKPFTKRKGY